MNTPQQRCIIVGAGPAGLTAGLELARVGVQPIVFEADDQVGGISRTVNYKGFRFDIGGHRFFTKVDRVHDWWMDILESEFLVRPRLSRIYYNDTFFDYPLKPFNALKGLGAIESMLIGLSYAKAQLFPHAEEQNLEQWVSNRFGNRLYSIFFKTYTEKVWGMKCTEIGADWAAQRIKNLDLKKAVLTMLAPRSAGKQQITSLIERFHYPKYGPGQMWERVTEMLGEMGHPVFLGRRVVRIHRDLGRVTMVTVAAPDGEQESVSADHIISSMPIKDLVNVLDPPAPAAVIEAANRLRYRDFLTVGLVVDQTELFPDNWIYIHSPKVKVGRIQNYGNWSPHMVPDPSKSCIGLEYFVQEGDAEWSAKDEDLIELAKRETAMLGLVDPAKVVDGVVIRIPKAYPVYDQGYKENLAVVREHLAGIANLQLVGRNGQHRYNNQDHSMMTAFYAAENIVGGQRHDVWDVNVETEYHEESRERSAKSAGGDRIVPQRVRRSPGAVLTGAFAKYDPLALGIAVGTVCGSTVFLATAILLLRGGENVGRTLSLLANYFLGFEVTWLGAVIGLTWGAVGGFVIGVLMAFGINATISFHLARLFKRLGIAIAPDD